MIRLEIFDPKYGHAFHFFHIKTGPWLIIQSWEERYQTKSNIVLNIETTQSGLNDICVFISIQKSMSPQFMAGPALDVGNVMPIVKCRWCPFFTSVTPWRTKRPGPCPARTHTRSSPADSNVSNSSCPVPSVPWLTCRFESKDDLLRIIQKAWIHNEYHNSIHQQDGSFDLISNAITAQTC